MHDFYDLFHFSKLVPWDDGTLSSQTKIVVYREKEIIQHQNGLTARTSKTCVEQLIRTENRDHGPSH
jgi:hypothetical protein